jgi:oligopeptide transport system permease protein
MAHAPAQSASLRPLQAQSQSASLWKHAWQRLRRNKLAVAGGSAIILLALLALGADVIAPYHYATPHFGRNFAFPNHEFLLAACRREKAMTHYKALRLVRSRPFA